jgi:hypothetical protein
MRKAGFLGLIALAAVGISYGQAVTDSTNIMVSVPIIPAKQADTINAVDMSYSQIFNCKSGKLLKLKINGSAVDTTTTRVFDLSSVPVGSKYMKYDSVQIYISVHQIGFTNKRISNVP